MATVMFLLFIIIVLYFIYELDGKYLKLEKINNELIRENIELKKKLGE